MYDTVTADEGPFIKVMNVGERIEVNRIEGGSVQRPALAHLQPRISPNAMLLLLDEYPHPSSQHLLCACTSLLLNNFLLLNN